MVIVLLSAALILIVPEKSAGNVHGILAAGGASTGVSGEGRFPPAIPEAICVFIVMELSM